MNFQMYQGFSLFLIRAVLILIFLWHGIPKAFNPDVGVQKFVNMGFPGFLGPIVGWAEVIASVMLLFGFMTRWASLALAAIIVVAILGVQLPLGFQAGLERDLLVLVATLALAVFGPGVLAMDTRENATVASAESSS